MNNARFVLVISIVSVISSSNLAASPLSELLTPSISMSGRSIEIRRNNSHGSRSTIRGDLESDGSFKGRDRDGNKYKGDIDDDGYGKLKDSDGNTFKVKPRY